MFNAKLRSLASVLRTVERLHIIEQKTSVLMRYKKESLGTKGNRTNKQKNKNKKRTKTQHHNLTEYHSILDYETFNTE